VRCKRVDRRADIWAFGCVLYEVLTGLGAFTGETISDNLAAVIHTEPEWSFLPAAVPPRIREVLRLCLQKDAKQRLQAIGDARITIEEVLAGARDVVSLTAPADSHHSKLRERMTWIAVVALLTLASTWFGVGYFSRTPNPAQPIISQISPPENTKFILTGLTAGPPVLSPDGTLLAFAARSADGKQFLWVRSLDRAVEEPLAGNGRSHVSFLVP
jgi:serine/threonine-protein kinase